jgi:hypothetical protein
MFEAWSSTVDMFKIKVCTLRILGARCITSGTSWDQIWWKESAPHILPEISAGLRKKAARKSNICSTQAVACLQCRQFCQVHVSLPPSSLPHEGQQLARANVCVMLFTISYPSPSVP